MKRFAKHVISVMAFAVLVAPFTCMAADPYVFAFDYAETGYAPYANQADTAWASGSITVKDGVVVSAQNSSGGSGNYSSSASTSYSGGVASASSSSSSQGDGSSANSYSSSYSSSGMGSYSYGSYSPYYSYGQ